jgi:hypothetical protein
MSEWSLKIEMKRVLGGSSSGLILGTSQHLPGETEETHKKISY